MENKYKVKKLKSHEDFISQNAEKTFLVESKDVDKNAIFYKEELAKEYVEFKNNQSLQNEKIKEIILFIREERLAYSDEEGDDMFTNELIEKLEDLING